MLEFCCMNRNFKLLAAAVLTIMLTVNEFAECVSLFHEVKQLEQQIDDKNVNVLQVEFRDSREEYNEEYINKVIEEQQENIMANEREIASLSATIDNDSQTARIKGYIDTYDLRHRENRSYMPLNYTFYQYPQYPTGCESVALHILLRYYDVNAPVDTIIARLRKSPGPWIDSNGIRWGYDPEEYFIGDPYSAYGYGVFHQPIGAVAETFKPGVQCRSGLEFSEVMNLIDQSRAVLVWSTIDLQLPEPGQSWKTPEGKFIQWLRHEHAVVVVGYDDDTVTISDPHTGSLEKVDREQFIEVYNMMGKRAIYY